jgi:hypothetical protein
VPPIPKVPDVSGEKGPVKVFGQPDPKEAPDADRKGAVPRKIKEELVQSLVKLDGIPI